jgi:small subunit ribosomal protein S6
LFCEDSVRDYELVVVLSPDVGDEGYPTVIERISSFIQERGGEIKNVDQWGRRRLAYPIHRHLEGYYAVTRFAAEPPAIRPLEANLDLAEDVLRHLVIRLEEAQLAAVAAAPARAAAGVALAEAPAVEAPAAEAPAEAPAPETTEPEAAVEPAEEAAPAAEEDTAAEEPEG